MIIQIAVMENQMNDSSSRHVDITVLVVIISRTDIAQLGNIRKEIRGGKGGKLGVDINQRERQRMMTEKIGKGMKDLIAH